MEVIGELSFCEKSVKSPVWEQAEKILWSSENEIPLISPVCPWFYFIFVSLKIRRSSRSSKSSRRASCYSGDIKSSLVNMGGFWNFRVASWRAPRWIPVGFEFDRCRWVCGPLYRFPHGSHLITCFYVAVISGKSRGSPTVLFDKSNFID